MATLKATIINKGPLTEKEAQILRYLCEGYFRPEIALKLHRSIKTVSTHIEHIYQKLNAHSTTEVVVIAQQLNMVDVEIEASEKRWLQTLLIIVIMVCGAFSPAPKRRPPQAPRIAARQLRQENYHA